MADEKQTKIEPGLRYDSDKSRVDLIPPEFIEALGLHFGLGARKYSERNWEKGMSWSRCYASAQRHMLAFWRGEEVDEETGTPHVVAAAWNMAALHWYSVHGVGTDDRYKADKPKYTPLKPIQSNDVAAIEHRRYHRVLSKTQWTFLPSQVRRMFVEVSNELFCTSTFHMLPEYVDDYAIGAKEGYEEK